MIIYDIFGREVEEIKFPHKQEKIQIMGEGYPPGIYVILLKRGQDIEASAKFVIAR